VTFVRSIVGQVGNLQRIVNPPAAATQKPRRTDGYAFAARHVRPPILAVAAFQAALSGIERAFAPEARRLKAGGSQAWLPHKGDS